jgi:adenylate cyclase 9
MQATRDQSDMLLSNIIPHHVVEEIKMAGKYSKNHDMVAVMFASITNWDEMYEESYEGRIIDIKYLSICYNIQAARSSCDS